MLGTVQKILNYGLRDLEYRYVVLDDYWSAGRFQQRDIAARFGQIFNWPGTHGRADSFILWVSNFACIAPLATTLVRDTQARWVMRYKIPKRSQIGMWII